jgi:hypothetical protein
MKSIRLKGASVWVLLILGIFMFSIAADAECVIGVQDAARMSEVSVETCSNVGVFSVGTFMDGGWQGLTYKYPRPWKGTYLTVKVGDSLYSNSMYALSATQMDQFLTEGPTLTGAGVVSTKWSLPEGVVVEQTIRSVDGGAAVDVKLTNAGSGALDLGARLSIDLMVDGNDGAPVLVPDRGVMSSEFSYSSSDVSLDSLTAQDRVSSPYVTALIQPNLGASKVQQVKLANWKTGRGSEAWDYATDSARSTALDSAIMLYYVKTVSAGQSMDLSVYFGHKAADVKPSCSDGIKNQNEADVDCAGPCKKCAEGGACAKNADCQTGLCSGGVCAKPAVVTTQAGGGGGFDLMGLLVPLMAVVAAVVLLAVLAVVVKKAKSGGAGAAAVGGGAAAPVSKAAKGEVLVSKERAENNIKVSVNNASSETLKDCVLIDGIPPGAEVKFVAGKNVSKKRKHLVWTIGELKAGEKAVMEYSMNVDKKAKIENFSFLSQNPVMAKITEN